MGFGPVIIWDIPLIIWDIPLKGLCRYSFTQDRRFRLNAGVLVRSYSILGCGVYRAPHLEILSFLLSSLERYAGLRVESLTSCLDVIC